MKVWELYDTTIELKIDCGLEIWSSTWSRNSWLSQQNILLTTQEVQKRYRSMDIQPLINKHRDVRTVRCPYLDIMEGDAVSQSRYLLSLVNRMITNSTSLSGRDRPWILTDLIAKSRSVLSLKSLRPWPNSLPSHKNNLQSLTVFWKSPQIWGRDFRSQTWSSDESYGGRWVTSRIILLKASKFLARFWSSRPRSAYSSAKRLYSRQQYLWEANFGHASTWRINKLFQHQFDSHRNWETNKKSCQYHEGFLYWSGIDYQYPFLDWTRTPRVGAQS